LVCTVCGKREKKEKPTRFWGKKGTGEKRKQQLGKHMKIRCTSKRGGTKPWKKKKRFEQSGEKGAQRPITKDRHHVKKARFWTLNVGAWTHGLRKTGGGKETAELNVKGGKKAG